MQETSGIYIILCVKNWKYYVGSSIGIEKRWDDHRDDLNNDVHCNPHFQNAWKAYGEDSFIFLILEEVPLTIQEKKDYTNLASKKLLPIEQRWLDLTQCYDPEYGFNLSTIAGSPPIYSGAEANAALLTMEQVREIRRRYSEGENPREIEKDYPVARIAAIVSYQTYYEDDGLQEKIKQQKIINQSKFWVPLSKEGAIRHKLHSTGENNPSAKLTWKIVNQIRSEDPKVFLRRLVEKYQMSTRTISRILRNEKWYDQNYTPPPKYQTTKKRKLNFQKAEQIRQMYKEGIKVKEIAIRFDIDELYTYQIIDYSYWKPPGSRNKPSK